MCCFDRTGIVSSDDMIIHLRSGIDVILGHLPFPFPLLAPPCKHYRNTFEFLIEEPLLLNHWFQLTLQMQISGFGLLWIGMMASKNFEDYSVLFRNTFMNIYVPIK